MRRGPRGVSGCTQAQPHSGLPTAAGETLAGASAVHWVAPGVERTAAPGRPGGVAWLAAQGLRAAGVPDGKEVLGGRGSEVLPHVLTSAGSAMRSR